MDMLWKDKYELGIPVLDKQHKELFKRVESFIKVLRSPECWEDNVKHVNDTLEFMKVYVVEHFHDEEEYQKKIGYPGYNLHKEKHEAMVAYVLQVCEEYEKSGYNENLMQQFAGKLMAWLINHVAAEDQRIADFAKNKEV